MPPRTFHHLIKDSSASIDRDYATDNPVAASMATHDSCFTGDQNGS
jgi:hypothetical protein